MYISISLHFANLLSEGKDTKKKKNRKLYTIKVLNLRFKKYYEYKNSITYAYS
ncbi:hypothetical protein CAPSP0001_2148 [Capnocytophaga sputigena ATCC 33612]|nr:hypothetical protein CAPSP0001_2148 [Capnocytophaga sputigena ATCC 33612]